MGQANNSKRNATLDERKRRAAGRDDPGKPERDAILDAPARGQTGGAFGRDMHANRKGGATASEGFAAGNIGRKQR